MSGLEGKTLVSVGLFEFDGTDGSLWEMLLAFDDGTEVGVQVRGVDLLEIGKKINEYACYLD